MKCYQTDGQLTIWDIANKLEISFGMKVSSKSILISSTSLTDYEMQACCNDPEIKPQCSSASSKKGKKLVLISCEANIYCVRYDMFLSHIQKDKQCLFIYLLERDLSWKV